MSKPTREHVKRMIKCSPLPFDNEDVRLDIVSVLKAYLSQEEEIKALRIQDEIHWKTRRKHLKDKVALEAENQALRASMEADYIERQAKHIRELVKENEALKDKFDWFKNEREKDSRVIDRLLEEKQKLEAYITEKEGYQP